MSQCSQGLFCDFSMSPPSCKAPAQLGQPCSNAACDVKLYCDTTQATPVCAKQLAAGATCTSPQMCLSFNCVITGAASGVCSSNGGGPIGPTCTGR